MVFYIVACNEDNKSEEQILKKIAEQVLVEKGRSLGTVHHMSNEKVSAIYNSHLIIILMNRS